MKKLFFKLKAANALVFSIDFPEAICPLMLSAILELYCRLNVEASLYGMGFDCSDMSNGIQIYMCHGSTLAERQAFAQTTLSALARFCGLCDINPSSFFYVKSKKNGIVVDEAYKPRMALKHAMTYFIEKERLEAIKTQLEAVVFDTLREALSAGLAAKYAMRVVENMLETMSKNVPRKALEGYLTHRPH